MRYLTEASKNQIISAAKKGQSYKERPKENRFTRRNKSSISTSTSTYNDIDVNKFFKDDILDVDVPVDGETDSYIVSVSFSNVLETILLEIANGATFDYRIVLKALLDAFRKEDIYVMCSCPDWQYRIHYWASMDKISMDPKETRPSDKTNPNNTMGQACKHVCLVLNNTKWCSPVARVITNYVRYMEHSRPSLYSGIIEPAIYGTDYAMNKDSMELGSGDMRRDQIAKANEEARNRGKFKKGNTQGVRFAKEDDTIDNPTVNSELPNYED